MKSKKKQNHGGQRFGSGPKIHQLRLGINENNLILDALNGIIIDRDNAEVQLPIEIDDAIRLNHLDTKWSVDANTLLAKLRKLSHAAALEIVDSADKFWNNQS